MLSYITSRDQNLMRRLNGWQPPRWIRMWMVLASRVGDGWLWYALGIMLMIFGGPNRFVAVGAATLSAAISVGLVSAGEADHRQKETCRAALLGDAAAAGSVLVSIRAFDDGVLDCGAVEFVLSAAADWAVLLRDQYCFVAHSAGIALFERRDCWICVWRDSWVPGLLSVPVIGRTEKVLPGRGRLSACATIIEQSRYEYPVCREVRKRHRFLTVAARFDSRTTWGFDPAQMIFSNLYQPALRWRSCGFEKVRDATI